MASSRLVAKAPPMWNARRQLAAQAATAVATKTLPSASTVSQEAKATALDNGLKVISVETDPSSDLATLGVAVRSASRFETYETLGAAHALRMAAGLGTKRFTQLSITKTLQQAGTGLKVNQGREHIFYAAQMQKSVVDEVSDYLLDVVGGQAFKSWEIERELNASYDLTVTNFERLKVSLAEVSPSDWAKELLHKAAYRTGLGNSMYMPEFTIGNHQPRLLKNFYRETFTGPRTAIVGIGIDSRTLQKYGEALDLEDGKGLSGEVTKYYGGEQRKDAALPKTFVSLAAEGTRATNLKEAIAGLILQKILGAGSRLKYSSGNGRLQKALKEAQVSGSEASSFNAIYSDSGLLGANIVAAPKEADKVVRTVASVLRSLSATAEEVSAAKRMVLMDAYDALLDNSLVRAEDLAQQIFFYGEVIPVSRVPQLIDSVQIGDVQALAKKIAGGKLSLGAYGNLANVPYLDAL